MRGLRQMWTTLLDILLPRSSLDRAVLSLTPETLSKRLHVQEPYGVMTFFSYRDPLIRRLIALLKYKGHAELADVCTSVVCDYLKEERAGHLLFSGGGKPLILPIPLSRKRRKARGFNQTELIARALCGREGFPEEVNAEILIKIADTPPQTSLSRKGRLTNLRGVFAVAHPELVAQRDVVLIDDVTTTGATLREAQRAALKAGARSVHMLALAH